jgi:hypothetical protein
MTKYPARLSFMLPIFLAFSCSAEQSGSPDPSSDHVSAEDQLGIEIDRFENGVQKDECVGNINRWQREYFPPRVNKPSSGHDVQFVLREAEVHGFEPVRKIDPAVGPDDRKYKIAVGSFNGNQNRYVLDYCGDNVGNWDGASGLMEVP